MDKKPEAKPAYPGCLDFHTIQFEYLCRLAWHELTPDLDRPDVRHCQQCDKSVHVCRSMDELQQHAKAGHCVALYSEPEAPLSEDDPVVYFGYVDGKSMFEYTPTPPLKWD